VRSGPGQAERLLGWAASFPERTWAIENAAGLGYLLAQQLGGLCQGLPGMASNAESADALGFSRCQALVAFARQPGRPLV
jgi:hypothetical protein